MIQPRKLGRRSYSKSGSNASRVSKPFFTPLPVCRAGFRGRGRELCTNQKTANKRERRPVESSGTDRGSEEVNVSFSDFGAGVSLASGRLPPARPRSPSARVNGAQPDE